MFRRDNRVVERVRLSVLLTIPKLRNWTDGHPPANTTAGSGFGAAGADRGIGSRSCFVNINNRVRPLGLALAALVPTIVAALAFRLL